MKTLTDKQKKTAEEILKAHPDQDVVHVVTTGNHMYFDKSNALACAKEEDIVPVYRKGAEPKGKAPVDNSKEKNTETSTDESEKESGKEAPPSGDAPKNAKKK